MPASAAIRLDLLANTTRDGQPLSIPDFPDCKYSAAAASSLAEYSLEDLIEAGIREGVPEVWEELVCRTQSFLYRIVRNELRKWRRFPIDSAGDIVQDVYLKLSSNHAAMLRGFTSRHSGAVLGYMRAVAVAATIDYCRSRTAKKRGSGAAHEPLTDIHRVEARQSKTETAIFLSQINRALDHVLPFRTERRDRAVFWLHYRDGLNAHSIAAMPSLRLTSKGVESIIQRITKLLRGRLVRHLPDN